MLSRRALLAGAIAAPVPLRRAAAETQISQQEARYQDHPNGQQRCAICVNFQPPDRCRFVTGEISKSGWCQLFAAKENAH